MSGNNWSKGIATLALSAVLLLTMFGLLFYAYQIGVGSGSKQAEANGYAAEYPADTAKRIDQCWAKAESSDQQECIEDAIKSSHESQRSEKDLRAQREMSDWAFWLLVITAIQTPVTIAGLLALLETIKQGSEANLISRQSVEAATRAWVTIKAEEVIGFNLVNGAPHFTARLKIKNIGSSPAVEVSYFMSMAFGDDPKNDVDETLKMYRNSKIEWKDAILFPSDHFVHRASCEQSDVNPQIARVAIYMIAAYKTVFSDEWHFTAHLYQVIDRRRDDGLIEFANYPYGNYLHLRPNPDFVGYAT